MFRSIPPTPRPSSVLPSAAPLPTPDRWDRADVEPALHDLLSDPMTALVMQRDGIRREHVLDAVATARRHLRARGTGRGGPGRPRPDAGMAWPGA
jgi:hypothetical protein